MSISISYPFDTYYGGNWQSPVNDDCQQVSKTNKGMHILTQPSIVASQYGGTSPIEVPTKNDTCCLGTWSDCSSSKDASGNDIQGSQVVTCGPNSKWFKYFTPLDKDNSNCYLPPRPCDTRPCPINCELSDWSNWSTCISISNNVCPSNNTLAFIKGTQSRFKTIDTKPQYGGLACGHTSETQTCTIGCPVNCQMEWSQCLTNIGYQSIGQFYKPVVYPQNNGTACPPEKVRQCLVKPNVITPNVVTDPHKIDVTVSDDPSDFYILTLTDPKDTSNNYSAIAYGSNETTHLLSISGIIASTYNYNINGYKTLTGDTSGINPLYLSSNVPLLPSQNNYAIISQSSTRSIVITATEFNITASGINSNTIRATFTSNPTICDVYILSCQSNSTNLIYTSYTKIIDNSSIVTKQYNGPTINDVISKVCNSVSCDVQNSTMTIICTMDCSGLPVDPKGYKVVVYGIDPQQSIISESSGTTVILLTPPTNVNAIPSNIVTYTYPFTTISFDTNPLATSYTITQIDTSANQTVIATTTGSPYIINNLFIVAGTYTYTVTSSNSTCVSPPSTPSTALTINPIRFTLDISKNLMNLATPIVTSGTVMNTGTDYNIVFTDTSGIIYTSKISMNTSSYCKVDVSSATLSSYTCNNIPTGYDISSIFNIFAYPVNVPLLYKEIDLFKSCPIGYYCPMSNY